MSNCVRGRIGGVWLKNLCMYADDRGLLTELVHPTDPYYGTDFTTLAQTTFSMSYPGVIKAFHWHRQQDDAWFCVKGMLQSVLYDQREGSPTFGLTEVVCMGEWRPVLLVIPRGVAHGYRVLGDQPAWLVYHASAAYNAADPDEQRIPYDDPTIGFDWTTKPR